MSEHVGYIVKIEELHPHSNADRLQIATIFGASVIVDLNTHIGDFGVYFPIDLQLSEEYCKENDLVRRKDENGNPAGGYLDPEKRNIRAMKLRGERSEGLFMPLASLAYTGETKFEIGDKIDILNGHEICRKYIPRGSHRTGGSHGGNRTRKRSVPIAPLFAEHADTEQLAYNLDAFKPGDQIEITLKMHGTSGRTGYLPKLVGYTSRFPIYRYLLKKNRDNLGKMAQKMYDQALANATPIYNWDYVTGTRRTVIDDFDVAGGFYGNNKFREPHARVFEGKLRKGETVYYEIVGFTDTGASIMAQVPNSRISDKEFTKKYGKTTTFSYGCDPAGNEAEPQSDMYVYRMTMTNEDGDVVEYSPDFMRYRCEQMGVKCVPVFLKGYLPNNSKVYLANGDSLVPQEESCSAGECAKVIAEQYYDGPDPIGKTHVREGVVVRIVNRPKFTAYKHKNFSFKCLEGIAKDIAAEPDMEEAEEVLENEN